jgi:hypothetical protein
MYQRKQIYTRISSLSHYTTNRNVAVSTPDEAIEFFSVYLILPVALRPARKADSLTAICEPIVKTVCGPKYLTTL